MREGHCQRRANGRGLVSAAGGGGGGDRGWHRWHVPAPAAANRAIRDGVADRGAPVVVGAATDLL
jgi:hypothetical protein